MPTYMTIEGSPNALIEFDEDLEAVQKLTAQAIVKGGVLIAELANKPEHRVIYALGQTRQVRVSSEPPVPMPMAASQFKAYRKSFVM